MTVLTDIRAKLEAECAALIERKARLEADLAEPLSADWEEQAVEREDDDALRGQAVLVADEISAIQVAITRIDNGSYGTCMICGDPIAPARLEAMPTATRCLACATA